MKSAFLMLDLQNEMVGEKGFFGSQGLAKVVAERGVLANSKAVLDAARAKGVDPVFVRLGFRPDYSDSLSVAPRVQKFKAAGAVQIGGWGTEFPTELSPAAGDLVVTKTCVNPFFNTGLMTWLMSRGVKQLFIAGVVTNAAVESAVRFADDAGFAPMVVEDCCAAPNAELHEFSTKRILPMFGEVVSSAAAIEKIKAL